MNLVFTLLKTVSILVAAVLLGRLFLDETRKTRTNRKPWYAPYITVPGILVIVAILLPIVVWIYRRFAE